MTRRLYLGNIGGGGLRISKPGYDVVTEAYGSRKIAFDSRLSYLGNVLAAGLIQCGGSQITFGPLNYVPIVQIKLWDGTDLRRTDFVKKNPDSGTTYTHLNGGYLHAFIPAVAIVTTSTLKVVQYTIPFYDTTSFYNANGLYYFYTVYAIG
jgi:hypothetical protein